MIYHDQNKDDNRMINDLVNSDKELIAHDSRECEDWWDDSTMFKSERERLLAEMKQVNLTSIDVPELWETLYPEQDTKDPDRKDMDSILPLRTPVDDGKKIPDFSNDLFEYGVNLSKEVLDSLIPTDAPICPDDQTGYQSYQDSPESDIEQALRQIGDMRE